MGPWAHRKLFWPLAPCFPYPRLSHRTTGPPQSTDAAQLPRQATEPSGCFSLFPSAPVTRPLGNFRRGPEGVGWGGVNFFLPFWGIFEFSVSF